ncbi:MAG TPA: hypothetical protein VMM35_01575 [Longimicrobiales bacterium]|nr:hypothetical protein [Longimicrobiales bacterium]
MMRRHLLTIAVILTGATGCDNVAWGGVDWRLTPPPSTGADTLSEATELAEQEPTPRVYGPLLLAGTREGPRATLAVVGEVQAEGLLAVEQSPEEVQRVAELTAAGSEWTLFADGVRVGTLTVDERSSTVAYCPPRPTVSGIVELVPSASQTERLLALPAGVGEERSYDPFQPMSDVYDQRVATLTWAGDAIPRNQASWPAEGLVEARRDIRVFQPAGAPGPAVAATFMYRDRLAVTPAPQGSYALFVLGSQRGGEYLEDFAWYRLVGEGGKGAPRYFDHLDWDGDGDSEILLEVLGAARSWFAALGRRDGQWVRTFLDVCGATPAAGG